MRLFSCHILLLSLFLACGFASAGSIAKRSNESSDDDDSALTNLVNNLIYYSSKIPLVGNSIAGFLAWMVEAFDLVEIATNGAIARLLGGALPCTITLQQISCSGLSQNGGFGALLLTVLDDIPSLILPSFAKTIIRYAIEFGIDPIVDMLLGGVPISA